MKPMKYIRLIVFLLICLLLAACAAPRTDQPADGTEQASGGDDVVLEFWTFADYATGPGGDLMQQFIDEYEAANPNVTVELVGKPDTEIQAGVITGASAHELPDLFANAYNSGYEVATAGAVQDVSAWWNAMPDDYKSQFAPAAVEGLQHDGKMYGVPYTLYSAILYRNLTVLRDAGIDPDAGIKDWDDWITQMQQVSEADYTALPNYAIDGWLIMHYLGGVEGVHNGVKDGKWTVTPEQLAEAYSFLASARQYGTEVSPFDASATDLFITNKMAFYTMGPWANPTFEEAAKNNDLDYDYVLIPGAVAEHAGGVHGGEFLAITPGPNAEEAFKFATFLADKAQMSRFAADLGRANFNAAAMSDPAVAENPLVVLTADAAAQGMDDAAYFVPFPLSIRQPLTDYAVEVVEGRMTPEEAANAAVQEINDLLASE
jgi:multiple sugar transport system substrate-binding protein